MGLVLLVLMFFASSTHAHLTLLEPMARTNDSAGPAPANSDAGTVGSIELEFENCMTGVVRYEMPGLGLSGEVPIQRITDDNVALCEVLAGE